MAAPTFNQPVEIVDGPQRPVLTEAEVLERIRLLANLLDNQFQIPGTTQRIGLDGLIGLVPVVGDLVSMALSAYLIYLARSLNISKVVQARMMFNLFIDAGVGAIPVAGDIFDIAFKANRKNLKLLEKHLESRRRTR